MLTGKSPPWGGIDYRDLGESDGALETEERVLSTYSLQALQPVGGEQLFTYARRLCDHIVFYLPRNAELDEVASIARDASHVHVEELWMQSRLKALAVYISLTPSERPGP